MFAKLFYRRSLKDVLLNLSASDRIHCKDVTDLIAELNDLYLCCTYGDHFKRQIEDERAQIKMLQAEKKYLQKEVAELEKAVIEATSEN